MRTTSVTSNANNIAAASSIASLSLPDNVVMPWDTDTATNQRVPSQEELSKLYIPRGNVYEAFMYDRSPIVGLAGPAGTGKSRCALEKMHLILEGVPGARGFVARKTRESLTEAALYTYEERVLPPGHPCLGGAQRLNRSQYRYPNGSILVVVGLDKPQRIMSTEFDIGYVQEMIECSAEDIDMLMTRLRNGVLPYQQLIFDVNPDSPQHWVYQYYLSGRIVMYDTHHEDNPMLWKDDPNGPNVAYDGRRGDWTPNGVEYIEKLENLVGPRKQRLRFGKWVTAEGAVYGDVWEPRIHVCNRFKPPKSWRRIWSVDFGFTHPFVLQMWAIDEDGRMWMYKEIYRTQTLVRDNAKRALELAGWAYDPENGHMPISEDSDPLPDVVVCDWDAEGRATLEEATGLRTEPAYKSILDGIDNTASRLQPAGDGLPRMMFMRGSLDEIDERLKEAMHPTCTIEEFTAYVWDISNGKKQRETVLDKYNHGMDAVRYAAAKEDGIRDKFKASDVRQALHNEKGEDTLELASRLIAAVATNRRDGDTYIGHSGDKRKNGRNHSRRHSRGGRNGHRS